MLFACDNKEGMNLSTKYFIDICCYGLLIPLAPLSGRFRPEKSHALDTSTIFFIASGISTQCVLVFRQILKKVSYSSLTPKYFDVLIDLVHIYICYRFPEKKLLKTVFEGFFYCISPHVLALKVDQACKMGTWIITKQLRAFENRQNMFVRS